ncbi:hypothetical protein ACFL1G_01010 [Planctomycetota bacterium]
MAIPKRIAKIDYIAAGDPETYYYYNDQQVVEEYDWANNEFGEAAPPAGNDIA